ncbi:hypothetical protein N657DRAFT_251012 [Parathielavia appendiculata]|uniref:Uncharacterized protein n=1 Tax=Parathielavia appendiculata TaxID=2587402 RepID=A0AAN6TS38_9PEZI|nr:hypothetical protein N657DRAFT_251012 [Parathielavia appendiculata]
MTMPGSRNKPAPPLLRLSPVNRDRIYCFVGLASWDGHPFTSACTAPPASVGTPPSRQSRFPINSTACCFRAARRKIKQAQAEPSMCRSRRRRSGGDGHRGIPSPAMSDQTYFPNFSLQQTSLFGVRSDPVA